MTTFELLNIVISGLGLIVSTVVLVLLLIQLRQNSRETIAEHKRVQERATFEFIESTMLKMHEVSNGIPTRGSPSYKNFLVKSAEADSNEFISLRNYLTYLEDLAAGVNMGVFDSSVLLRTLGTRMRRAWSDHSDWIIAARLKLDQPSLFEEIEECAGRIPTLRRELS